MKLREKLKIALVASFIILLVIDVLDVLSTFLGFKIGFVEANSFPQWLITIFGPMLGLITGKAISLAVIGFVIWFVIDKTPKSLIDDEFALATMTGVLLFGILVLSNNFSLLGWISSFRF